jgi:hypothetical protein
LILLYQWSSYSKIFSILLEEDQKLHLEEKLFFVFEK